MMNGFFFSIFLLSSLYFIYKNGGLCQDGNGTEQFSCRCNGSFQGEVCDYDLCVKTHCEHGECNANFSDPMNITPKCDCYDGYFGLLCEQHLCDDFICSNGGICTLDRNDFGELMPKCNCTDEYVGEKCNIIKGCAGFPCKNEGQCKLIESHDSLIQESFN